MRTLKFIVDRQIISQDPECDLDIVPNEPRKYDLNYIMSNSLGFGGHNASIIIKKWSK